MKKRVAELQEWMAQQILTEADPVVVGLLDQLRRLPLKEVDCVSLPLLCAEVDAFATRLMTRMEQGFTHSRLPIHGIHKDRWLLSEDLMEGILALHHGLILRVEEGQCQLSREELSAHYVRALQWRIRQLRNRYALYEDVPGDMFRDLHSTFKHARRQGFEQAMLDEHNFQTHYVSMLLFAMSNPYGWGRDEMGDLYACILHEADRVRLLEEEDGPYSRFVDLTAQFLPHLSIKPQGRKEDALYIDLGRLVHLAPDLERSPRCASLMQRFSERLRFFFVKRDSRARPPARESMAWLVVGIPAIHAYLCEKKQRYEETRETAVETPEEQAARDAAQKEAAKAAERTARPGGQLHSSVSGHKEWNFEGLSLREEGPKRDEIDSGVIGNPFSGQVSIWDKVSDKGVLGLPEGLSADKDGTPPAERFMENWRVINTSPGGFRFRWNIERSSRVNVGDLVLIEEHGHDGDAQVGVIRWVHHQGEGGLDIGVEALGERVYPAVLHHEDEAMARREGPIDALLVIAETTGRSVVVPPFVVEAGDAVQIGYDAREERRELGRMMGMSAVYAQYQLDMTHG
ncbi:MAG: hypothetical protein AB1766_11905 [Pseudomonadota bacterium]